MINFDKYEEDFAKAEKPADLKALKDGSHNVRITGFKVGEHNGANYINWTLSPLEEGYKPVYKTAYFPERTSEYYQANMGRIKSDLEHSGFNSDKFELNCLNDPDYLEMAIGEAIRISVQTHPTKKNKNTGKPIVNIYFNKNITDEVGDGDGGGGNQKTDSDDIPF